jgi:hypothetical protein
MLEEAREHAREDVGKIKDPKGQALFETTAEVLEGLPAVAGWVVGGCQWCAVGTEV